MSKRLSKKEWKARVQALRDEEQKFIHDSANRDKCSAVECRVIGRCRYGLQLEKL